MSNVKGRLYVVATPIGNLGDMTPRAVTTLKTVDAIAAEDTRHSLPLLRHFGVATPLLALHEHNEREQSVALCERMAQGQSIALISDAGTPLVSDPGYYLVRMAHDRGIVVVPVPGPSAAVAALSAAGLATDRYSFEGFLPAKAAARRARLQVLATEARTLVFYEAPHRLIECLNDLVATFGGEREATLARELTKVHETVRRATLAELAAWVEADENQRKGEIVLVVAGAAPRHTEESEAELAAVLRVLLAELPVKQAANLASRITGASRNVAYDVALRLRQQAD